MARTNLAYDLSRFDDTIDRAKQAPKKTPEIKAVKTVAPKVSPIKIFVMIFTVAIIASALVYSQVVLIELGAQVNSLTNQVNVIKSENVRKATELDAKMSLKSIEEYAVNKLGYVKLDQSNIEYISLSQDNKIEIKKPCDKGIINSIKNFFNSVSKYFK